MKKVYKWYMGIIIFLLIMVIPASIFGWKTRIEQMQKERVGIAGTREEIVEVRIIRTQAEIYFEKSQEEYNIVDYDKWLVVTPKMRIAKAEYNLNLAIYYQNQEIIELLKGVKK